MSSKMSPYQQFIHKSRYARWLPEQNRREDWTETVHRYIEFFTPRIPQADREKLSVELEKAIFNLEVMPSMRALMTAGPALQKDNVAGYNCSFLIVDDPRAFDEAMYISMCGTGVGFSVERQFVAMLPRVAETFIEVDTTIKVADSKIGWANGFRQLIALLYGGSIPKWDLSLVRPAGAPLKTFGGRASGPGPLDELFRFTVKSFRTAAGRKLTSLECHDLMCKVAEVVVSGGVRRSAMISLSDLSDNAMRNAKAERDWRKKHKQRELSNNSVAYTFKPEIEDFMKEWLTLVESHSGERGIFNREAAQLHAKKNGRRKWQGINFGTNPCGEIILRPNGFCNLTEVVARPEDTKQTLKNKIRHAVILGCLQSTLTDFRYLRKIWQKNAEEERLLGVSLTGIADNALLRTNGPELAKLLDELREYAIEVCKEWARKLGIKISAAITCVKPSGTVSQLVNSSSGIHDGWSDFILRTVRGDKKDPLGQFFRAMGVCVEAAVNNPNVDVFYFPIACAPGARKRGTQTAIDQLELYLTYKHHWCEHNPSCTIYVKNHEWLKVGTWVFEHFDDIGGVSFLPYGDDETVYQQAPMSQITEAEYQKRVAEFPVIDWSRLPEFEKEDTTTSTKELACSAGVCELTDMHSASTEEEADGVPTDLQLDAV